MLTFVVVVVAVFYFVLLLLLLLLLLLFVCFFSYLWCTHALWVKRMGCPGSVSIVS